MISGKGTVPTHATLQRAAFDGFLAGIHLHPAAGKSTLDEVLGQDPDKINARVLGIAEIALSLLPVGTLTPAQKSTYGRAGGTVVETLAVHVIEALRVLSAQGVTMDIKPDQLQTLKRQHGAFQTFHLLGTEMNGDVLDQRALCGAFLAFLIDRIVGAIDRRFQAQPTAKERAAILSDFAPALIALDEVLRRPAERKQALGELRKDLAAEASEARADATLAETSMKLRQNLVVPREELFAAARLHIERTEPGALGATTAAAALPPAPGPRHIL